VRLVLIGVSLAAACSHSAPKPSVSDAAVDVIVSLPDGMTPADADRQLAMAYLRALDGVKGVVHLSSTSDAHRMQVVAWISGDADVDDVTRRIREHAQEATDDAGVGAAEVVERERGASLRMIVTSKLTPSDELRAWIDWKVRVEVMRTAGVADFDACGGEVPRLDVTVDPDRLLELGVGINDVSQSLRTAHVGAPAGQITNGGTDYVVRTLGDATEADLPQVVIGGGAQAVRLADVARVEKRRVPSPCAFGGPPKDIVIDVRLRRDADEDRVRRAITRATDHAPPGTTIRLERAPAVYDVAFVVDGKIDDALPRAVAATWRGALDSAPGVLAVEPVGPDLPEWTIDRPTAALAGIDVDELRSALSTLGEGFEVTTIGDLDRSTPVYLRAGTDAPIPVHGADSTVDLAHLAHKDGTSPGRVDRFDNVPAAIVRFTVADGEDADAIAGAAIEHARAAAPLGSVHVVSWREP
jgi:multidrug efflux pump subunit AcrB